MISTSSQIEVIMKQWGFMQQDNKRKPADTGARVDD